MRNPPSPTGPHDKTIVSTAIPEFRLASSAFFLLVPLIAVLNTGSVRLLAILLFASGLLLWLTGNYEQVTADGIGIRKRTLLSRCLRRIGLRAPVSSALTWEDIHRIAYLFDNRQPPGWRVFPSGSLMILGFSTQIEIPFRTSRFSELCEMIREQVDGTRLDFCFRRIEYLQSRYAIRKNERKIEEGYSGIELLLQTGYGYCLWGDYIKARDYLENAFRLDPSRPELKEDLAEILLFSGDVGRGLRLQREVSATQPDDARPLVRQGHLLLAIDERKDAISCFLRGTGLSVASDTAHLALSLVYEDMGIDGLARQHFESAAEKTQDVRLRAHLDAWRRYHDRIVRDARFSRREMRRLRLFQTERRLRKTVYWAFIIVLAANAANVLQKTVSGETILGERAVPLLGEILGVVSLIFAILWVVRRLE